MAFQSKSGRSYALNWLLDEELCGHNNVLTENLSTLSWVVTCRGQYRSLGRFRDAAFRYQQPAAQAERFPAAADRRSGVKRRGRARSQVCFGHW